MGTKSDEAALALSNFAKTQDATQRKDITNTFGEIIGNLSNLRTIGSRGPSLLTNTTFIQQISHFTRERIPARRVDPKGAAANGYFVVTKADIQKYSRAKLFNSVGKRTKIWVRFSLAFGETGTPDTIRSDRGMAIKFYTEDGNWDLTSSHFAAFYLRDSALFVSFVHANGRHPQTNLYDRNAVWDFNTLYPASVHANTYFYSDHGIPDGYRHMNGYSLNTYSLVNADGGLVYNRFTLKSEQGIKFLDVNTANKLQYIDPDYATHDLFNAIASENYPSWTLYVQIMTVEETKNWKYNPFDPTKYWPEDVFPLIEVGRLVLDRNPVNYFAEVEQLAFSPSNRVDGIEFSPDKVLQGRVYAYRDAQLYRLGTNHHLIGVNRSIAPVVAPTQRDGFVVTDSNQGSAPTYYPNSFQNVRPDPKYREHRQPIDATDIDYFESKDEDNYSQTRITYLGFTGEERNRLFANIARELVLCYDFIRERAIEMFARVDSSYADGIRTALIDLQKNQQLVE